MRVIFIPTAEVVLAVNEYVCQQGGNPYHCNGIGKVESAISTAFYPGDYPFEHGGLLQMIDRANEQQLIKIKKYIEALLAGVI